MPGHTFDANIIKGYRVKRLPENVYMSSVVLSELMTSAVDQHETGRREAGNGNDVNVKGSTPRSPGGRRDAQDSANFTELSL